MDWALIIVIVLLLGGVLEVADAIAEIRMRRERRRLEKELRVAEVTRAITDAGKAPRRSLGR